MYEKKPGKRMKGIGLLLFLIIGVLLLAVAVLTYLAVIHLYYADFAGNVRIPIENLEVVEASHTVESCLARLGGSERLISKNILEEYAGDSVNRICEIYDPVIFAYVEDIEDSRSYVFPPPQVDEMKKLFPYEIVEDIWKQIREWTNKKIKNEHIIWVSIAVPEVTKVTDEDYGLNGEFLVQARWEGLGSPKANDMILKLYSREYFGILPANINTVSPSGIKQWLEGMEKDGIKFDSRIVNFQGTPVRSIMPYDYELEDCDKMGGLLKMADHETCVEIFGKIDEIHVGRLGVEI